MSPVRIEAEDDGSIVVVLAAPPVNALADALLDGLEEALARAADARAVALVSAVPGIFLAGADLQFLSEAPHAAQVAYVERVQTLFSGFERLGVPLVAGIDGACLGGGLELALACDVRIVSPGASLGLPEARLGILPGAGGTQRLVRAVGQTLARDLLLTGRRLRGADAVAGGIASRLAADGAAGDDARALAGELAGLAPEALAAIKRLSVAAPDLELAEGLAAERREWDALRATPNAQEGIEAFRARRAPRFA